MAVAAAEAAEAAQGERLEKLQQAAQQQPAPAPTPEPQLQQQPQLDETSKKLLGQACAFLRDPTVSKAPMSAKVQYLHQKLRLGSAGIKIAVRIVYGEQAAVLVEKSLQSAALQAAGVQKQPGAGEHSQCHDETSSVLLHFMLACEVSDLFFCVAPSDAKLAPVCPAVLFPWPAAAAAAAPAAATTSSPCKPAPRKPWERRATHFAPSHLLDLGKVEERLRGGANEWREMLHDALKHVTKVVDFVPFNVPWATTEAQAEAKQQIAGFIETLEILKEDASSG
jgi:hypothetical protein